MRITGKLVVAAVAAVAIGFSASDANAFGHHRRGGSSGGSSGSWGSSGGSSGSWGSSGGSWGSSGNWGGSNGSWGGSSGGSSGGGYYRSYYNGSSGGWGSSGGSSGGYYNGGSSGGSNGGGVIYDSSPATPATPAAPADGAPAAEPAPSDAKSASTGTGLLMVRVPADAKVFVNGQATNSVGSDRQYISRGLVRGASYNFEVKAEIVQNGEPITITKFAKLTAGGTADLSFNPAADTTVTATAAETTRTTLKVLVPADAKVFLAGNETKQTGDVREFTTTKLGAGDNWADYTVRAQAEVNGKLVTKEQVVSIKAGDTKEISFDFAGGNDDSAIAETASK